MPVFKDGGPFESMSFENVMHNTAMHAISAGKDIIRIGDILISIYDEKESFARYFLQNEGINKLDILNYISHGIYAFDSAETSFEDYFDDSNEFEEYDKPQRKKGDLLKIYTVELTVKDSHGIKSQDTTYVNISVSSVAKEADDNNEDDKWVIPGFEIIFVIIAIAVFYYLSSSGMLTSFGL